MGMALSVFRLLGVRKEQFLRDRKTHAQQSFRDFEWVDGLPTARSELHFRQFDPVTDRATYRAVHYSETIRHPIRVYLEDIEQAMADVSVAEAEILVARKTRVVENGYQEVHSFDVVVDFGTSEIFVFHTRSVAASFMKRFRKCGQMDFAIMRFDLSRVKNLPQVTNIFNAWVDSDMSRVSKIAYWGTDVHKEPEVDEQAVSSYTVRWKEGEETIDLHIAEDCRLSSKSNSVDSDRLMSILRYLRERIGLGGPIGSGEATA